MILEEKTATFDGGMSKILSETDYELEFVKEKGERWKEYREEWEKFCTYEKEAKFPPHLEIELNYSCNLRCPMCTWSAETTVEKKEDWFKFEEYERLIGEAVKKGTKSIRLCYVNEPLIRQDLDQFVKCAAEKGILDIIITTNGTLLTKEVSKKLIEAGITKVNVSLDAFTEDTYEKVRVGGDFNITKQNILDFIAIRNQLGKKIPKLKVSFVRTKINDHEREDFVKYWKDKVDGIGIQNMLNPFTYGRFKDDSKKELLEIDQGHQDKTNFKCPEPNKRMTLRGNGDVIGCCSLSAMDLVVGNWKNNNLEEIWNGEKMRELREIHKNGDYEKNPICKVCVENLFFLSD